MCCIRTAAGTLRASNWFCNRRGVTRGDPPWMGSQGDLPIGQGGALELVVADITQPATLLPEMFSGVNAAVLATAVKVVPKEGDGVQRDKYMQVGWPVGHFWCSV
jgi:hypothetical protein